MAWRLDPKSDIVVQLHMQQTGKPEAVQVSVGLFFTPDAPVRTPVGLRLGSETIDIPPGAAQYEVTDQYVLPVDVEMLAIQPHAHNLAREMRADATLPDGESRPLISIKDWDFRWQDVYRYARPFGLPRGTTISMRFTYDNSAANARNPFQPPRRILWGQSTSDEMGDLWLQVVPGNAADLAALSADIRRKSHAEDLAAYTKVLRSDSLNPLRHDAVAMLYLQDGRAADAATHLRESLKLNDGSAAAHYNLGIALSMQRNYQEAAAEFEFAIRIDPDHAAAHNNLGAMLTLSGRLDEAAAHYRRAVELRDDNAQAHNNLGRLLSARRQYAAAVEQFTRALALAPDLTSSLSGLAWVRATAADAAIRNSEEAVRLAERAAVLSSRGDASVLDTLAAAYAAAGQFDRASQVAHEAMLVADTAGAHALWVDIRDRLQLYDRQAPFIAR
jgi:tetratricopeptide (TPR) repeat protein